MGAISHRRLQCRAAARVSALVRARRKAESLVAEGVLDRRDQARGDLGVTHEGANVEQQSLEVDLRQRQAAPEQREQLEAPHRQPEPIQPPIDNLIAESKAKKELKSEDGFELPESEFGIKSEFEIKVEFGVETKPEIKTEPGIKAEPDIKAELKVKIEPRVKAEPGIKTETEIKQELDAKVGEAEKKEEYLKMEDDFKAEGVWIEDVQMEWVVAIKEELVKLEDAPWSRVPYYCYYS